jgi:hypothetical protein
MFTFSSYFSLFGLYRVINLLALFCAVYYYLKGKRGLPQILPFLLILIVLELYVKGYWSHHFKTNILIQNLTCRFTVFYYLWVYYNHFKAKSTGKWILVFSIIYFIYVIYRLEFDIYTTYFDFTTYLIGLAFTTLIILKYLYDIIYVDIYRNILREPIFYFSIGILIFFVSDFQILFSINELVIKGVKLNLSSTLVEIGNIFLSLGYLGAVLCMKHHNQQNG